MPKTWDKRLREYWCWCWLSKNLLQNVVKLECTMLPAADLPTCCKIRLPWQFNLRTIRPMTNGQLNAGAGGVQLVPTYLSLYQRPLHTRTYLQYIIPHFWGICQLRAFFLHCSNDSTFRNIACSISINKIFFHYNKSTLSGRWGNEESFCDYTVLYAFTYTVNAVKDIYK